MKYFLPLLFIIALLSRCNNRQSQSQTEEETKDTLETVTEKTPQSSDKQTDTTIIPLANSILKLLKNKDYSALAQYIHPIKGVRLSPYGYINKTENVIIKADQLNLISKDEEKKNWGTYDGTGDTIKLNFEEYFDKFVYDVDFLNAEKLSINRSLAQGNSLNNISEIYPKAKYTESYFPGFNKKYNGMDWRALRLVLEEHANKYYLVGIIHDEWTI